MWLPLKLVHNQGICSMWRQGVMGFRRGYQFPQNRRVGCMGRVTSPSQVVMSLHSNINWDILSLDANAGHCKWKTVIYIVYRVYRLCVQPLTQWNQGRKKCVETLPSDTTAPTDNPSSLPHPQLPTWAVPRVEETKKTRRKRRRRRRVVFESTYVKRRCVHLSSHLRLYM